MRLLSPASHVQTMRNLIVGQGGSPPHGAGGQELVWGEVRGVGGVGGGAGGGGEATRRERRVPQPQQPPKAWSLRKLGVPLVSSDVLRLGTAALLPDSSNRTPTGAPA